MTARQRKLGVTAYGIEQFRKGNYMADNESFLAWMSTQKKGDYIGRNILQKMYKELSKMMGWMSPIPIAISSNSSQCAKDYPSHTPNTFTTLTHLDSTT